MFKLMPPPFIQGNSCVAYVADDSFIMFCQINSVTGSLNNCAPTGGFIQAPFEIVKNPAGGSFQAQPVRTRYINGL